MKMLSKLCSECLPYVSGTCEGKEQASVKAGKKPCNKYVFATDELIGQLDNEIEQTLEPTDSQLDAVEPVQISENLVVELADVLAAPQAEPVKTKTRSTAFGSKPLEWRQRDFQRLSAARCNKAIASIKLLGNLNNRYAYDYADADVQALRTLLENTVKDVFGQF